MNEQALKLRDPFMKVPTELPHFFSTTSCYIAGGAGCGSVLCVVPPYRWTFRLFLAYHGHNAAVDIVPVSPRALVSLGWTPSCGIVGA